MDVKEELKVCNPKRLWERKAANINAVIRDKEQNVQVPSYTSVRKISSEKLAENDLDQDPLIDLLKERNLQAGNPSEAYLRKIQVSPLAVTMYSKMQSNVLKEVIKRLNKDEELVAYIDATGGLFRQPKTVLNRIFYYALVITFKNNKSDRDRTSFPVSELISSAHSVDAISTWLSSLRLFLEEEMPKLKWPVFNRIISDKSFANLNAISISFNRISLLEYLNLTYDAITKGATMKEKIKIHLCVCHIMKIISDDVKTHIGKNSAGFIIEIIASMFNTQSLDDIKCIWKNLSIILNSKYLNDSVKESLELLPYIVLKLKSSPISEPDEDEDDVIENEGVDNEALYKRSPYFILFENISKSTFISTVDTGTKNVYFSDKLLNVLLKKHIAFLPLWSGLLGNEGERYSNAYIEKYFGILKMEKAASSMLYGFNQQKLMRFIRRVRERSIDISKVFLMRVPKTRNCSRVKKIEAKCSDDTELTVKESMAREEEWKKPVKSSIGYFNMKNIKCMKNKNDIKKRLESHSTIELGAHLNDEHPEIKTKSEIELGANLNDVLESPESNKNVFGNGLYIDFKLYFILSEEKKKLIVNWILTQFEIKLDERKKRKPVYEKLTFGDFWTLDYSCAKIVNRYLSNFLVDYYLALLTNGKEEFQALLTYIGQSIMISNENHMAVNIPCKFCIMPILTTNANEKLNHYVLVILNTYEIFFIFLDPGGCGDTLTKTYFKKFCEFLDTQTELGNKEDWTVQKNLKYDTQSDSYNCGAYILHYAEEFISQGNFKNEEIFNANEYRDYLKKKILETSQDMTNRCQICGWHENDTTNKRYVGWTQCDLCDRWAHNFCLQKQIQRKDDYICSHCA